MKIHAQDDCPDCLGTGIIEGQRFGDDDLWIKNADRFCHCVPKVTIYSTEAINDGI